MILQTSQRRGPFLLSSLSLGILEALTKYPYPGPSAFRSLNLSYRSHIHPHAFPSSAFHSWITFTFETFSITRRIATPYMHIPRGSPCVVPSSDLPNVLPNCSYGIISQSMRKSGQHGGVLIAINNTVAIRDAEVSMPDCDFACATLLNSDAGFWLLIVINNPPRNSSYCLELNVITGCIDHFVSTARGLILSDAPVKLVIVGDFNLPDVNWETYLGSSEYFQIILNYLDSHNLIQNVMEPTHRSGNILELVFAADDTAVTVANVNLISDHYPITFDLVLELPIIRGSSSIFVYSKSSFNELCFWWNESVISAQLFRLEES